MKHAIFNEDMIYAGSAVQAGYAIAYEAEAKVYHSHNYTVGEQFRRNFDLGVSQADHPEIFGQLRSESEGKRLVKTTTQELRKQKKTKMIPYFYLQCVGKYAGFLCGRHYKSLPRRLVLALTSNREYWK